MDFSALLQQLDQVAEQNNNIFCNKNKNDRNSKDISGILYFNDEEFQMGANFLDNNTTEPLYAINANKVEQKEEKQNTYKQLSQKVKIHIDLDDYNLSHKYSNLTDCLLSALKYNNYNGKNVFFKKLLKMYDVRNLHKQYNYKKQIKM